MFTKLFLTVFITTILLLGLANISVIQATDASPQATLYSQTASSASSIGYYSQVFDDAPDMTSYIADDFVVPQGAAWTIEGVTVKGLDRGFLPTTIDAKLFNDNNGMPGGSFHFTDDAPAVNFDSGTLEFTVALDEPVTINACESAETVWLSVAPDQELSVSGEWIWSGGSATVNNESHFSNPLDGRGTGCTVWAPTSSCLVPGLLRSFDFDFAVLGTKHSPDCGDPLNVSLSDVNTTSPNPSGTVPVIILMGMLAFLTLKNWFRNCVFEKGQ